MTISGYQDVPQNDEVSLLKALAHQPLSVAIDASGRDFQFYRGVNYRSLPLKTRGNISIPTFHRLWLVYALIMHSFVGFAGGIQWTLWNWAWSWSNSSWIWVIEGVRLHHCEEFMGTKVGRERIHTDEEEHWKTRRDMRHQQIGIVSYQRELI